MMKFKSILDEIELASSSSKSDLETSSSFISTTSPMKYERKRKISEDDVTGGKQGRTDNDDSGLFTQHSAEGGLSVIERDFSKCKFYQ